MENSKQTFSYKKGITARFKGAEKRIISDIIISPLDNPGKKEKLKALWDTGCGRSLISKRAVEKLGLIPDRTGLMYLRGAYINLNIFLVYVNIGTDIYVPVEAFEIPYCPEYAPPFVLGLDVIARGNFSICQVEKNTIMSFEQSVVEQPVNMATSDSSEMMDFDEEHGTFKFAEEDDDYINISYSRILHFLPYECMISLPDDSQKTKVRAIFDTGAQRSMISKDLQMRLNLPICGNRLMYSVNKPYNVPVCRIKIHLSDYFSYEAFAGCQDEDQRTDLLIGMDAIRQADFFLKNMFGEGQLCIKRIEAANDEPPAYLSN